MPTPPSVPDRILWLTRLLLLALAGIVAASVAGWLARFGWPFELFVHFQPQYGVIAAALAVLLLLVRQPLAAVASAILAAAHLWPHAAGVQASADVAPCRADAITITTINLNYHNSDVTTVIDWLAREPTDLLILQELTPAWADAFEALQGLPYRRLLIRGDPYGLGVLSRWPLDDLEARDLAGDGIPSFVGNVEADGAPFRLAALHAHWPLLPHRMRRRDLVLETIADEVRRQPGRWIVAGDLNATPYSPVFQRLLDRSGLRDTRPSGAWAPSWRAGFWPLAMRIDHVLVAPDACVDLNEVGPGIGSDHRPVLVRVRWPAAG